MNTNSQLKGVCALSIGIFLLGGGASNKGAKPAIPIAYTRY